MLCTRGAISPIPSSSLGVSVLNIATIPDVDLTEPFVLSIPADSEPFPQMVDRHQDIVDDQDNEELDLNIGSEHHGEEQDDTSDTSVPVCDH